MRFRRIFIHIGLHKAGSSAIQLACDENRDLLARHGIHYPAGRWHGQLGSWFSKNKRSFVYNRHAGRTDPDVIEKSDRAYMARFQSDIENVKCQDLALSYEGFIDFNIEEVRRFREYFCSIGQDVRLIAYCRHPLSFAPSEVSQRARMGMPIGRDDLTRLPFPKFRDYIEKFELVFGKKNISIADFARETLYRHDIQLDFLSRIGVSDTQQKEFKVTTVKANESLSTEAIAIAEKMAKLLPKHSHENIFFLRFNRILSEIKGSKYYLTEEQSRELMAAVGPHLDYLEKTFGLRLQDSQGHVSNAGATFAEPTIESIAAYIIANDPISQAYRWMLGHPPESEDAMFSHLAATHGDMRAIRASMMHSAEFRAHVLALAGDKGGIVAAAEAAHTRAMPEASRTVSAADVVRALYRVLLLREPQPVGLQTYTKMLGDGGAIEDVIREVLKSPEFAAKYKEFMRKYLPEAPPGQEPRHPQAGERQA